MVAQSKAKAQASDLSAPEGANAQLVSQLDQAALGARFGNAFARAALAGQLSEDDLQLAEQLGVSGLDQLRQVAADPTEREALLTLADLAPDPDQLTLLRSMEEGALTSEDISQLSEAAGAGVESDDLDVLGQLTSTGAPVEELAKGATQQTASRQATLPYRGELEQAFGEDLSGVDVQVGAASALSPLMADAAAGDEALQFASANPSKEDVIHEVTHLVQDRRQGTNSRAVSTPDQAGEVEAEQAVAAVQRGEAVEVGEPKPAEISRKAWYSHVGDFASGAWGGLKDTVTGLSTMGQGLNNLVNPAMWVFAPEKTAQSWNTLTTTTKAVYAEPSIVWDAFKEPFVKDWNEGRPGAAIGRGVFEVVSLLVGAKGLDKLAKGSKVLNVVDDAAKVGTKLDDAAKVGTKLDDVAEVGSKTDDVAKVGTKLDDAAEVGKAVDGATKPTPLSNKLNHIFGKPEHALDDFVKQSGGQEQALQRIQDAANVALKNGLIKPGPNGVLPRGDAGLIIDVGGTQIRLIGGLVKDGVVYISSASRKGLP